MRNPPRLRHLIVGFLACVLASPSMHAIPEPGKAAYTVFMGVDLELEHQKSLYRVEDVAGSYFVVRINGKEEMIPTRDGSARMRIDNSLKLAGTPLKLDDLKVERTYTPERDPHRQFQKEAASASGQEALQGYSEVQVKIAAGNLAMVTSNPSATPTQIAVAQDALDRALSNQYNSYYNMGSDLNSAGYHEQQLEIELAKENFDAIEVSLHIVSPIPLDDPYILVIARIHERDEKPGVLRNWIFAQKLDPIEAKPRKVYIKQGGFPIGYTIEDYQVRVYNHGREIPTNYSPKRVDLTRDQAQQYVLIDHLAAHKNDTIPAVPVFGEAPADLKTRLLAGEYSSPFYVKVDANGNALGTFTDKDCTNAADDPYVQSFVANVLFAPALDKGKPVAGVAHLRLGALLN